MLRNIKLCFLIAIFATICYKQAHTSVSYRDRVIGCLYSEVCSSNQVCFDDNAFGRCEELDETGKALSSDYVYQLDRKTLQLLEKELDRLSEERFSWRSAYTQCVLKTVLNERPRIVYDPSACDYLRGGTQQESLSHTNRELDSDFPSRPLKTSDEDQFVSPRPSSATVKNGANQESASGQVQQPPPSSSSSIIADSLPSSAPRPSLYSKDHAKSSSPKLADSNVKSKLRATHLKRTPSLWANLETNLDSEEKEEADRIADALSDRQIHSLVHLLLTTLLSTKQDDADQPLDTQGSEYDVLQAVPTDQYLQYQSSDNVPYVTNSLIDRKYDQQRQQQAQRPNVPLLPLYRTVPYTSSRLEPLPRLKYPEEDLLLPPRYQQPDDDDNENDIYILNAPLAALLAAQRPEVRVLRNTDEEQSEEDGKDAPEEDLVPVGPSPFDQDVIMVDVIDQDGDSSEQEKDDATLIANILQNALQNGADEEDLQREKDAANIENLLGAAQDSSDSDSLTAEDEAKLKDMKELLLGDINYNNNFDTKMPNFYRKHRYDIKKPGPKYYEEYFFKPDNEDTNNNNYESDNKPLEMDGEEEPTDEEDKSSNEPVLIETQLNSLSDPLASQMQKKDNSIRSSKPVSEGPVKVDAKSENTIIIRSAEVGEETSLEAIDSTHTYVVTDKLLGEEESQKFVQTLEQVFKLPRGTFSNLRKEDFQITFKVNPNYRDLNASQVASRIEDLANTIKEITGYNVKETGIGDKTKLPVVSATLIKQSNQKLINLTLLICSVILAIISAAFVIFLFRRNGKFREKVKGFVKASEDWMSFDYQDLCRQRMQGKSKGGEKLEEKHQASSSKCSPSGSSESMHKLKNVDTGLANQHDSTDPAQQTPPSRASTSSWVEEPVSSNMDITTGHIILSYMEDHLKKKDRLDREWEALCAYEADPCATNAAFQKQNASKNRYPDILAYDHSRVILNDLANANNSDYINANTITDHDPRNPAYIVTQGALSTTKADFWQMIWEQGSTTIVMLTRLRENGLSMCDRYWPEEGSEIYQNYEVHLVSEHIWCDDYLVRSFYLKNLKTSETRSVTQFHFLSWPEGGIPPNTKSILDFRRKVNKSYKGRSCPIVVHCSDGIGRTGTYILIDMVLNRLAKGAKEIDIAATLEHIRDQRGGMVKNKAQFEFVLLAVAEEVQAILKALAQN